MGKKITTFLHGCICYWPHGAGRPIVVCLSVHGHIRMTVRSDHACNATRGTWWHYICAAAAPVAHIIAYLQGRMNHASMHSDHDRMFAHCTVIVSRPRRFSLGLVSLQSIYINLLTVVPCTISAYICCNPVHLAESERNEHKQGPRWNIW